MRGALLRAFAFHKCDPQSISGIDDLLREVLDVYQHD